jgi:hypothetical protein
MPVVAHSGGEAVAGSRLVPTGSPGLAGADRFPNQPLLPPGYRRAGSSTPRSARSGSKNASRQKATPPNWHHSHCRSPWLVFPARQSWLLSPTIPRDRSLCLECCANAPHRCGGARVRPDHARAGWACGFFLGPAGAPSRRPWHRRADSSGRRGGRGVWPLLEVNSPAHGMLECGDHARPPGTPAAAIVSRPEIPSNQTLHDARSLVATRPDDCNRIPGILPSTTRVDPGAPASPRRKARKLGPQAEIRPARTEGIGAR